MEKEIKKIKEAIEHINEILQSDCNETCKKDHLDLKRWLEELLEIKERKYKQKLTIDEIKCKNCKFFVKNLSFANCCNMEVGAMNDASFLTVNPDFGCIKFERIEDERV